MLKRVFFLMLTFIGIGRTMGQSLGCTDPQGTNFDSTATLNSGNCIYPETQYRPALKARLNATLSEISGMVYFKNKILALNDGGGGNKLYVLDTLTGAIQQTITVGGATNIDWEEMALDSHYIYVGDFGNNANGNRKNLCIYKIPQQAFKESGDFEIPADSVQKIWFSYADQTNFTATGSNNTSFDCEAMVVRRNNIHLLTKNWIGSHSVHYQLSTDSGTHIAQRLDSLQTGNRLITGASLGADDMLLLTSYTGGGVCALHLVYGFGDSTHFFENGNKRRFNLPGVFSTGQLEAVCMVNATRGFLGSETFSFVQARLFSFKSIGWILPYYQHNQLSVAEAGMIRYNTTNNKFEVFNSKAWENMH